MVAVDIPSGIDVATGAVSGPAVHAALTVTFGGLKPVHALADCGRLQLIDIGLDLPDTDVVGFEAADVAARWPVPGPHDDKYTQGVTGVMAGSSTYPGAAVLCTGAAVAATSGMVRYSGSAHGEVLTHWPEVIAVAHPGRRRAGAGLGRRTGAGHRRNRRCRTVVRVGGRPAGADRRRRADHPGRAPRPARLPSRADRADPARRRIRPAGRCSARRRSIGATRKLADALGATVLLKGNVTVVAEPGGKVYLNPAGQSWAATAGSGDVLSGMIGALLAAGLPPAEAAAAAAFVHARAAALSAADPGPGDAPTSASRILGHIRSAIASL